MGSLYVQSTQYATKHKIDSNDIQQACTRYALEPQYPEVARASSRLKKVWTTMKRLGSIISDSDGPKEKDRLIEGVGSKQWRALLFLVGKFNFKAANDE